MKKFITVVMSVLLLAVSVSVMTAAPALAQVQVFQPCSQNPNTAICKATSDKLFGPGSIWNRVLNVLTYIIGGVSVLMVVIGGLRYTISAGDQGSITAAKNTILYALIGLVVAIMANAIVNFVLSNI